MKGELDDLKRVVLDIIKSGGQFSQADKDAVQRAFTDEEISNIPVRFSNPNGPVVHDLVELESSSLSLIDSEREYRYELQFHYRRHEPPKLMCFCLLFSFVFFWDLLSALETCIPISNKLYFNIFCSTRENVQISFRLVRLPADDRGSLRPWNLRCPLPKLIASLRRCLAENRRDVNWLNWARISISRNWEFELDFPRGPNSQFCDGLFSGVPTPLIARVGLFFSIHFSESYKICIPSHRSETSRTFPRIKHLWQDFFDDTGQMYWTSKNYLKNIVFRTAFDDVS